MKFLEPLHHSKLLSGLLSRWLVWNWERGRISRIVEMSRVLLSLWCLLHPLSHRRNRNHQVKLQIYHAVKLRGAALTFPHLKNIIRSIEFVTLIPNALKLLLEVMNAGFVSSVAGIFPSICIQLNFNPLEYKYSWLFKIFLHTWY